MSTNQDLVERVREFADKVRNKNPHLALNVGNAITPLQEYQQPLQEANREQLLKLKRVGPSNVDYLLRVFSGEEIKKIVANVPTVHRSKQYHEHKPLGPGVMEGVILIDD